MNRLLIYNFIEPLSWFESSPVQFLDAELHSLSPGQQFFPLLPVEINKLKLEGRTAAVFKIIFHDNNIMALFNSRQKSRILIIMFVMSFFLNSTLLRFVFSMISNIDSMPGEEVFQFPAPAKIRGGRRQR